MPAIPTESSPGTSGPLSFPLPSRGGSVSGRGVWLAFVVGGVFAIIAGLALVYSIRPNEVLAVPAAGSSSPLSEPPIVVPVDLPVAGPPSASSTTPAAPPIPVVAPKPKPATTKAPTRGSPNPACNPPYTINENGVKRYKVECL
jgi:serine/threonine-protein kinase